MLENLLIYISIYFGLFIAFLLLVTFFENKVSIKPKGKNYTPGVSVVVPACNEEKTLAKTIHSLLDLDYPKERLEIIIVDDGSTDRTYEIAKSFLNQGAKVYTKPNGGKGSALNLGIKKSSNEFIAGLDSDSFVSRDSLRKMVIFFKGKKVMAVTPSMKVYRPQSFLQKIQAAEYLLGVFLRKTFAFMGSIHVTPGPFSVYRKSFFEKNGLFDEKNLTEDIEMALRIQSKHYKIENAIDAEVYTIAPKTFVPLLKQRLRWYTGFINNIYTYKRLFSWEYGNLGIIILPSSMISVMLLLAQMGYHLSKAALNSLKLWTNYNAIGYDVAPFISNFKINFFYLTPRPIFVLSVTALLALIIMIYLAVKYSASRKNSREKILAPIVLFVFLYPFYFAFWWAGTFFCKLINLKIGWEAKE